MRFNQLRNDLKIVDRYYHRSIPGARKISMYTQCIFKANLIDFSMMDLQ